MGTPINPKNIFDDLFIPISTWWLFLTWNLALTTPTFNILHSSLHIVDQPIGYLHVYTLLKKETYAEKAKYIWY